MAHLRRLHWLPAWLAGIACPLLTAQAAQAQTAPVDRDGSAPAQAQWPVSAQDEEERLGPFLRDRRAAELREYWATAAGGLATGVPQFALGIYMDGRADPSAQAIGPGLMVGGITDCVLGVVPLLMPTPISVLQDLYEKERRSGRPAEQVVHDVEQTWRALVEKQRSSRLVSGIIDVSLGVPGFVTGLVFALSKPGLAGMSPQTQYGWAGALVGFDFVIYQGIVTLAAPPTVDTAFDTYQLFKYRRAADTGPRLRLAPGLAPGGGVLGVAGTFF